MSTVEEIKAKLFEERSREERKNMSTTNIWASKTTAEEAKQHVEEKQKQKQQQNMMQQQQQQFK